MPKQKPRLLIFIVAYYAEKTLVRVLDRIPRTLFDRFRAEIVIVDDASDDRTFEFGKEYRRAHPELPVTVLRNEFNQGYGGNQKVGYAFAIDRGFDYVVLVHADGQYAPEELLALLEPLVSDNADAVIGTRMAKRAGPRTRAMPLYKYAGNRLVSAAQNALLGTHFTELHCGYRAYSVKQLKRLPFHLNSNDYHFDTELFIQLLHAGARIVERPVPTYYGGGISHANGVQYAANVLRTTLQSVFHRTGLLYQRKFDTEPQDNTIYDLKLGYPSSHTMVLDRIPAGSRVLDIGSGPGELAREIVQRGSTVTVVDKDVHAVTGADIDVFRQDLDEPVRFRVGDHTHLLMLDIIEHLKSPERFLEELRTQFTYDTKTLIMTSPNVAFVVQRLMLALGQFNYGKRGILDQTHTRLFTFRSLERLLRDTGYRIKEVRGIPAPFPKVLGNGILGRTAVRVNLALIALSKTLFSYQILVEAETTPDVAFVLGDTLYASSDEVVESRPPRSISSRPPNGAIGRGSNGV
ncbi:MAG TPA: bifunctional glycosyltransferase/class I SAM-dependent methyltransferase [Polyangiaceae bacterium]|nr:bifunctional glycosyltransferase/class I SAM-dependent methyltransferase [Polyangiaceae bacterium]